MRRFVTNALGVAILATGVFVAQPLQAQDKKQASYEQMMEQMGMMIKGVLSTLSSPDAINGVASYYKDLYEALLRHGFTKEEAMRIVVAQGPVITTSGK